MKYDPNHISKRPMQGLAGLVSDHKAQKEKPRKVCPDCGALYIGGGKRCRPCSANRF